MSALLSEDLRGFRGQPGPVPTGRAGDGELGQLCRRGCGGQEIPDLNKGEWLRGHPEPGNTQPFGKAKPLCLPLSPSGQNQALPTAQQGPWSCLTTCSPLALPHLLTLPAPGPLHLLFSHPRAHFPAGRLSTHTLTPTSVYWPLSYHHYITHYSTKTWFPTVFCAFAPLRLGVRQDPIQLCPRWDLESGMPLGAFATCDLKALTLQWATGRTHFSGS